MLEMLMRSFAHTDESDGDLKSLADLALGTMVGALRPLGSLLTRMPATTTAADPRAGASFALYRSVDYLPHRRAAWRLSEERLAGIADFSAQVAAHDGNALGLDSVHATIAALPERLRGHVATQEGTTQARR